MSLDKQTSKVIPSPQKAKRTTSKRTRERYSKDDVRFMNSLTAAVLSDNQSRSNMILYIIAIVAITVIAWVNYAELDERTRGTGRVIPSRKIQVLQNLEGGIVEEIRVHEGDPVIRGQILVTIDDTGAGSSFAESDTMIHALKARAVRLRAEAGIEKFVYPPEADKTKRELLDKEKRLYDTNARRNKSEKEVLTQRLKQRKIELSEARLDIKTLKRSQKMIAREMELTEPLVKKRLVSELEFIQLKQKVLEKQHELDTAGKNAESLISKITEAENQIREQEDKHRGVAQEEYNKVMAEIERMSRTQVTIEDRVKRTDVRSPVDGTVKQLMVNTVGGVVKPGMDIIEIVPNEDKLMVEAKIRPSDIAFLYPGLKAVMKLTAYDFAIYGGLEGKVVHISADTITDERQEEFYLVRVMTDKNYLGTKTNMKKIIVGMTAQVDIITGKKSIMQYLMKPILRAKNNALRER